MENKNKSSFFIVVSYQSKLSLTLINFNNMIKKHTSIAIVLTVVGFITTGCAGFGVNDNGSLGYQWKLQKKSPEDQAIENHRKTLPPHVRDAFR